MNRIKGRRPNSGPLSPGFEGERVRVRGRTTLTSIIVSPGGKVFPLTPALSPSKPGERGKFGRSP
ncbi:hypothetical protein PX52LOC_01511 [Limnoglobus roseus]|uniref:Uncharacterized protein n=1 Tax=Limnoglobus roseus TaxID=2598579 RepID=A0A5C1A7D7_9BACT|nr:hypothetical protein PX52LOC_01511 [Limnoglobus roseus]